MRRCPQDASHRRHSIPGRIILLFLCRLHGPSFRSLHDSTSIATQCMRHNVQRQKITHFGLFSLRAHQSDAQEKFQRVRTSHRHKPWERAIFEQRWQRLLNRCTDSQTLQNMHKAQTTYGIETAGRVSKAGEPGGGSDLRRRLGLGVARIISLKGVTCHRTKGNIHEAPTRQSHRAQRQYAFLNDAEWSSYCPSRISSERATAFETTHAGFFDGNC